MIYPMLSPEAAEEMPPNNSFSRSRLLSRSDHEHSGILLHEKKLHEPLIPTTDGSSQALKGNLGTDDVQTLDEPSTPMMFWIVSRLSVGPLVSTIFYMIVLFINAYYIG